MTAPREGCPRISCHLRIGLGILLMRFLQLNVVDLDAEQWVAEACVVTEDVAGIAFRALG